MVLCCGGSTTITSPSQLCSEDLLLLYSDFLAFDDQSLQKCLGPFLEHHKHSRPSEDQSRALVARLIRPELNRSETAIHDQDYARVNPLLVEICNDTYKNIANASNQMTAYQKCFNSLPRAVLECSAREQLCRKVISDCSAIVCAPIESEVQSLVSSLELRERDCVSFQHQLMGLRSSHSWKITSPLRALGNFFRAGGR